MKKVISLLLAFAMLLSFAPLAEAAEVSLVPLETDETGVLPYSAFLLSGYEGDEPELILNGEKRAKAEKNADGSFKMSFDEPFGEKELLKLKLTGGGTWAFQSAVNFAVKSTVPGNNGQNVPARSGIEFTFTHSDIDIESVEKNFSIKPRTDGKWEKHGNSAVFVPTEPLEYGEEYFVFLGSGAARKNGTTLGKDFEMKFSVEEKAVSKGEEFYSISSRRSYFETPSSKAPELEFYRFTTKPMTKPIKIEVFPLGEDKAVDWLLGNITTASLTENLSGAIMEMECENAPDRNNIVSFTLPEKLKNGFYAVRAAEYSVSAYTIVQSTDIAMYMTQDGEKYGLWLNDFSTGDAVSGAKICTNGGAETETDADGIALFKKGEDDEYVKISANGETAYYVIDSKRIEKNKYHVILRTERAIYKPSDTVCVWGAVMPYGSEETPSNLELDLMYGYNYAVPALTEKISPEDGVFSSAINLPLLSDGRYMLLLKNGDEVLARTYINVYEYVKPDYKLTVKADKKAVFLGEKIKYTANASFFDMTGLPNTNLEAYCDSWNFESFSQSLKTDGGGTAEFEALPKYTGTGQGRTTYTLSVRAQFPQEGEICESARTTVLLNNISASVSSEFKNGTSTIKLHSDTLTTDKANRGEGDDYINAPDAGREFNGTLSFIRYVSEKTGTKYDPVTKKTYDTYKETRVEEKISELKLTTDSEGNASYSFVPKIKDDGYYMASLTATDDLSREYTATKTIRTSEDYWTTEGRSTSEKFFTDKEKYDLGDTAKISLVKDGKVLEGKYLYIRDYNGITEMKISGGEYETTFDAPPRIFVKCVSFDPDEGYDRHTGAVLEYDSENSRIKIEAESGKEKYSPGDVCEIKIRTTDKDGNPVGAKVSAGIVDEAVFELREMTNDALSDFFSGFTSCVSETYVSHRYQNFLLLRKNSAGDMTASYFSESDENGASGVRSDFKDTAAFISCETDEEGEALLSFKLPDDITSWRVTLCAVNSFGAGDARIDVPVTMDAFLSCVINETYIIGDKPTIAATLYGDALTGDEEIEINVKIGDDDITRTAKAFERVNIPLPRLEETGEKSVTVTAKLGGKTLDAIEKKIRVIDTYNKTVRETIYDTVYDDIIPGDSGNVRITFTDKSRASLLGGIFRMRAWAGERIDQKLANYKANELLKEYYGASPDLEKPDFSDYQYYDGAIKLLPYSSEDEEVTYKIAPYIADFVNKNELLLFLRSKARSNSPGAVYALAALGENVLDEARELAKTENLSITDSLYTVLAVCEMGDMETAAKLYEKYARGSYEEYGDEARVVCGEDEDDILEATSLASLAAIYLAPKDAEKLYNYCVRRGTEDILISLEIMAYTIKTIENLPEAGGSVTYEYQGKTYVKEFKGRAAHSLEVPSEMLGEFKVISATDGVAMASECEKKMEVENVESPYVTLGRKYYKADGSEAIEFAENEIVECEVTVRFSKQALKGGYVINDYLPSGLEFFKSEQYYVSGNGQRVNISCYHYSDDALQSFDRVFTFYARVVSAGEYTADAAVMSNNASRTVIAATGRDRITIKNAE